jgi:hypothetical protein
MENKKENKVISFGTAIIVFILIAIVWSILSGIASFWKSSREQEGVVKYDDCRQIITIQDGSWQTYYHKFTCSYIKTKSGAIMSGECVRVENDSSLFSSSHTCSTAYVYEKKINNPCTVAPNIYLGYDDMCYTTPQ